AAVDVTVTAPDGRAAPLMVHADEHTPGRFTGTLRLERPGVYRMHADARSVSRLLGSADAWTNVGGADREFADPRLNEAWLRRVARDSGGRYTRVDDVSQVEQWLASAAAAAKPGAGATARDLSREPWMFAIVIALLCAEWTLR